MDEDMPMDTSQDVFYFTEGALVYAGYHVHEEFHPLHTHSFVEIAFVVGGTGTHHCLAGRHKLRPGAGHHRPSHAPARQARPGCR